MQIINIMVRDRIATRVGDDYYICGNADFVVKFDFDEEWDALDVKTARFVSEGGAYQDQIFSGNECPVPTISNTDSIRVGVFAGNLKTTTPARVPAARSILCGGGAPADPLPDVYNQIMERLNQLDDDIGGAVQDYLEENPIEGLTGPEGPQGPQGDPGSDATVTADSIRNALGYTPADVTAVFEAAESPLFTNVFDTVAIEYGKLLNSAGGVEDTDTALAVTDFIPITKGQTVRMKDFALTPEYATPCVNLYAADKSLITHAKISGMAASSYYFGNLVSDENGHYTEFTVLQKSTLAYIRICINTAAIGKNPVLTVDEEITYEMGSGTKMNPAVRVDYSQITNSPQKNGWSILPDEHLAICYSGINRKPINTVEHFTDAAENFGYNALKCDVRPTSDGELVCCHDAGFTFDANGYITTYDSSNQTKIHDVTAATCLGYSFATGEHPCLVGDYLDVCRKYGKVAFVTIRNEYMDVVIPKLLEELRVHNMTHSTIINCMTYESLVQWRQQDNAVMINYTLNFGVAIDQTQLDRAVGLGYCSLSGFSLSSAAAAPSASCDFEYARANGIRLLEAIAYHADSPETCYAMGYDGCMIGIPWGTPDGGVSKDTVQTMIDAAIGSAIGGSY